MEQLRSTAMGLLDKGMYESAALIAEHLANLVTNSASDVVLFAKCYHGSGQYRRCLSVLEQRGYLSSASVSVLGQWLDGSASVDAVDNVHKLQAVVLAAHCLFSTAQHEDCVTLLQPLVRVVDDAGGAPLCARLKRQCTADETAALAAAYCVAGRCYDVLEHRARARRALKICVHLDPACVEAGEYMVDNGLLTNAEQQVLLEALTAEHRGSPLLLFYQQLLTRAPVQLDPQVAQPSVSWFGRCAERQFEAQNTEEAYRLARHAFSLDPHDPRCLAVYIASMVVLKLKTELFYLGHELVNTAPKSALSWYAVGSYYWCCDKLDLAQKNLVKATKLDKRLAKAWVLLGHVMSRQEESEQAISAYRTASRLLPGDHRPMVFIAKELVRTNHLAPALHILAGALDLCPDEPGLLNELGVTYMKQGSMDLALRNFELAVHALDGSERSEASSAANLLQNSASYIPPSIQSTFSKTTGAEIFSNYATALRKCERFEEALHWYDKSMAACPNDANCHAAVGFTFHLMQRFDQAISSYHQALSLDPGLAFCADMLNRAMEDMSYFPSVRPADAAADTANHPNFTRRSNYHIGADPVESGELRNHAAEADRSFGPGAEGYAMEDGSVEERSFTSYNMTAFPDSELPSEMHSPGFSMAQSFSKIEGRLSVSGRWDEGGDGGPLGNTGYMQDNSFVSQGSFRSDHGGFLEDSF